MLINNDCLLALDELEENSVDAIVTDPPYELNFMGKGWDNAGISFSKDTWAKCLRVLKPGGYLLAFGGSRTYHRIACAIEDAGFEIRDCIMWLYGSGFPKSMNISKGIEAREQYGKAGTKYKRKIEQSGDGEEYTVVQTNNGAMGEKYEANRKEYTPKSQDAKKWAGWGTTLKPSYEPVIVARKPLDGSCVANVMKWGVGGINIDECRVGDEVVSIHNAPVGTFAGGEYGRGSDTESYRSSVGRFPANTILTYDDTDSEEVCRGFPNSKGGSGKGFRKDAYEEKPTATNFTRGDFVPYNDDGSAARYFYCAKASKKDRDEGLEEFDEDTTDDGRNKPIDNPYLGEGTMRHNIHPTVKPTTLMQYLVRLVTPKGGTVLDPFMGSGSTGKAVAYENNERNAGYKFIGIEKETEYCKIAEARIKYVEQSEQQQRLI